MPQGLRLRLRSQTRDVHTRLDAAIAGLFEDRVGYGRYLRGALAARGALEALVSSRPSPVPEALIRPITDDLSTDLRDVLPTAHSSAATFADTDTAGAEVVEPRLWGIGYVLAGSALGAITLQKWAGGLGFSDRFGARHLAAQVAGARSWPHFVGALEQMPMTTADEADCIDGAILAFTAFESALEGPVDG
jgi:heme oxygenase